jgi:two-component system, LytTR family, response regulator
MIKAFIVDNEEKSIGAIYLILKEQCPGIEVVGMARSMQDALIEIPRKDPNLLILDVEILGGSGFELLKSLPEQEFETIIITNNNNFAIQAFKYNASDYILKPINIEEFTAAIKRVTIKINKDVSSQPGNNTLLENLKSVSPSKIAISTNEGVIYISICDIIRIEGEGSYSRIHLTSNKKILASKMLKEFQSLLNDKPFFRTHNSHLINIDHVVSFQNKDGGAIEMTDGSIVSVARRKKEEFLDIMSKYSR